MTRDLSCCSLCSMFSCDCAEDASCRRPQNYAHAEYVVPLKTYGIGISIDPEELEDKELNHILKGFNAS